MGTARAVLTLLLGVALASCQPGATRWEEFPAAELDRLEVQDFPLPNPKLDGPAQVDLEASDSGGDESHFFVHAMVNGVPASLLLDTGWSRTLLFPRLASRARVLLAPIRAETRLLGEPVPFNLGEVGELRLGPLTMQNFQVLVARKQLYRAPGPMDGMLGLDFLRRFAVTLDYGRRSASLRREGLPVGAGTRSAPLRTRKSWAPFGLQAWIPEMECRIDGAGPHPCIFDSGASSAVVFVPREAWAALGFGGDRERRVRMTLGDLDLRDVPARRWDGDAVQFGPAVLIAAGYGTVTLDFPAGTFTVAPMDHR